MSADRESYEDIEEKLEEERQYLAKVQHEVNVRGERVKALDSEIDDIKERLGRLQISRYLRRGESAALVTAAASRSRLTRQSEALRKERKVAVTDLERALERLGEVKEEIVRLERLAQEAEILGSSANTPEVEASG